MGPNFDPCKTRSEVPPRSHPTGRHAVVEDSDWRTMMALARFRPGREPDPVFAAWLGRTRPLAGLAAIRAILGLDGPAPPGPRPGGALP
jgi:hypothetical protein